MQYMPLYLSNFWYWKGPQNNTFNNKKLIRRWDNERELSLRRHRTRTTKYNRLMHKFRHRSTQLCVCVCMYVYSFI